MKALLNILNSDKTNIGKLELVKALGDEIIKLDGLYKIAQYSEIEMYNIAKTIHIFGLILDVIKTKPTCGKNQLKDLFLEKILNHLG